MAFWMWLNGPATITTLFFTSTDMQKLVTSLTGSCQLLDALWYTRVCLTGAMGNGSARCKGSTPGGPSKLRHFHHPARGQLYPEL